MKKVWIRVMPKKFKPLKCHACKHDFHGGCRGAWCICDGCSLDEQRAKTVGAFTGELFGKAKKPALNGRLEPYEVEEDKSDFTGSLLDC